MLDTGVPSNLLASETITMLDRTELYSHQNYSDIENLLWFYFLSKSETVLQQLKKKKKKKWKHA